MSTVAHGHQHHKRSCGCVACLQGKDHCTLDAWNSQIIALREYFRRKFVPQYTCTRNEQNDLHTILKIIIISWIKTLILLFMVYWRFYEIIFVFAQCSVSYLLFGLTSDELSGHFSSKGLMTDGLKALPCYLRNHLAR